MPDDTQLQIRTISALYHGDIEAADGILPPVSELKAITAADGLLFATPEYNDSILAVFKNAIDWLSRPPADIPRVFGGKPQPRAVPIHVTDDPGTHGIKTKPLS
jgi:chromate reductase, NAD(P)H dehydrogenase (quinone)